MKFWAEVSFKGEKNAEYLIRAFFKDFNPKSCIEIKGKEARIEIFFDEPPMEIIEAITHCDVKEFHYGGEYEEEKPKQEVIRETISKPTEPETLEKETAEQPEPETVKVEIPESSKSNKENYEIPELTEIAEKSRSYESFVQSVVTWLEMDKRQEFFKNLIQSAEQAKKITWKDIKAILNSNGVQFSEWDKSWCTIQVATKFKGSKNSVTILKLIKGIIEYKDYDFDREQKVVTEPNTEEVTTECATVEVEVTEPKSRVRMECMPEIPHFEEILGSVDKTQPVEERVKYVLTAMGLNKKSAEEQKEILEIANAAVRLGKMSDDLILLEANIPNESSAFAWMTFSKFINDFVKEYDSDCKVKVLDFLKEMQNIILYESEIESLADSTD